MLKVTFLFGRSSSAMAASIRSEPTNLEGLASAVFIAICDFLIIKSNSHPSGLTVRPLLFEEIILGQIDNIPGKKVVVLGKLEDEQSYDYIENTFIPNAYNKLKKEMNYVDIIRNSGINL